MFSDETRSTSTIDPEPAGGGAPWEGHRRRLRRRMESEGWNALKPYEMVELLLYPANPRQDLSDLARRLVNCFGAVGDVFCASLEQLQKVPGMTDTLAEWIVLTGDLMRAYSDMRVVRDIRLSCYREVLDFLGSRLSMREGVGMWVLYADFDFNFITFGEYEDGARWWRAPNVHRMLKEALGNGARYVYLVIRRPDARADMDGEEMARLEAISATLRAAKMDLVDCLLVGDGIRSLNMRGRMDAIRAESGRAELYERYADPDAPLDGGTA